MKLIDKDKITAEIEKRMQELHPTNTHKMQTGEKMDRDVLMWLNALTWVKKVIATLEVKEVDLDKELDFVKNAYYYFTPDERDSIIARHFYELGLKTKNKKFECWLSIKEYPLEKFVEVLAYNKEWVDEDKCPNGIRIGFLAEDGFISATWNMEHDCYDTAYEEGDDYYKGNVYVIEEEQKRALPNMPTHYMIIPNYKAQKGE